MNSSSSAPARQDVAHETDLVVLGGGPGGYTAAFRAADLGMSVTLIDQREQLGGVCLHEGCIPSKALLESVKTLDDARDLSRRGITFQTPDVDIDGLRTWKNDIVSHLAGGLQHLARQRKVNVMTGHGVFTGPSTMTIAGKQTIRFSKAIIASGSRPVKLPFLPDDPRILDSTGALMLQDVPKRLLIIGGGIIGLEMATVYAGLGSKVTVVEQQPRLLAAADVDIVAPVHKRMKSTLDAIHLETVVVSAEAHPDHINVKFNGPKGSHSSSFDKVLVAVGRRPNTDQIGLDAAGIATDDHGLIPTDDQQRTVNPAVYAIGDCVRGPMLAHKATFEGRIAAESAAGLKSFNQARVIPQVAYCHPEVAWVGITEAEATAKGIAYERASFPWMANGRAHTMGCTDGLTKMLVEPGTHRLLGIAMVGAHAGDLIAEAALALESDLEPGDIALTIHAHPTLAETLALASEAYEGTLTELFPPRRK
jgi:dihydrolipoamide dehydrogenase